MALLRSLESIIRASMLNSGPNILQVAVEQLAHYYAAWSHPSDLLISMPRKTLKLFIFRVVVN